MKKNFCVSFILFPLLGYAEIDRIQSIRFDRGSVRAIYLAPGLGSVVTFPCPLLEVFVGRSEDLKTQISPNDKKTLFLNLKLNSSLPTNVIARCEAERSSFVFDVIPSRAKHQDVVEIRSYFGGPGHKSFQLVKNSDLRQEKTKLVLKKPELVEKGISQ